MRTRLVYERRTMQREVLSFPNKRDIPPNQESSWQVGNDEMMIRLCEELEIRRVGER
jgi:hypothetical protein